MRPIFRTWLRLRNAEARHAEAAKAEEQLQRLERAAELQGLPALVNAAAALNEYDRNAVEALRLRLTERGAL